MDDRNKFLKNIKYKSLALGKNKKLLKKSMDFLYNLEITIIAIYGLGSGFPLYNFQLT